VSEASSCKHSRKAVHADLQIHSDCSLLVAGCGSGHHYVALNAACIMQSGLLQTCAPLVFALQGHLLSVKGHMLASLEASVASEQDAGASRLAAKHRCASCLGSTLMM
jgi:hypothetical protein